MSAAPAGAPKPKLHDLVRTPSGRTARVIEVRPSDGRRVCEYLDGAKDEVVLKPDLLLVVKSADVVPWRRDKRGNLVQER